MAPGEILAQWRALSAGGLNNRAVASRLQVTEAQLVATGCGTLGERLVPDTRAILETARRLGRIKFVVRNDFAVLERPGGIAHIGPAADVLRVDAPGLRLEIAPGKVASAFALTEPRAGAPKRSLQLFDASGVSVVKFVFPGVSGQAFDSAVKSLRHPGHSGQQRAVLPPTSPEAQSQPCREDALECFLRGAAELEVPLVIRVSNAGASLEAVSPVRRIKRSEHAPWINVLDPDIELHLYEKRINGLRLEPESGDSGWLHWLADGASAVSIRPVRDFAMLAGVG